MNICLAVDWTFGTIPMLNLVKLLDHRVICAVHDYFLSSYVFIVDAARHVCCVS